MRTSLVALAIAAGACTRQVPHERVVEAPDASRGGVVEVRVEVREDAGTPADGRASDGRASEGRASEGRASEGRASGDAGVAQPDAEVGDGGAREGLAGLAPLAGVAPLVELLDGRDKVGFVSVPRGARGRRPIVVALHGGSEKPEVACAAWRAVTEAYPFVVCPRGFGGRESALGWRTTTDTGERVARAVAATKRAFGAWVEETASLVLVGFSMGGSQVALLARAAPGTYRRIVVGDSAHDPQPALTFSRAWVEGGGERAVFLCSTSGCEPSMRSAARNVAKERAPARLNVAPTQVHGLSEQVVASMRRDWPWLIEGAPGWAAFTPASAELPGRTEAFDPE
jgi:pimeloyl-ACP methyl ester carboxylesterase